MRTFKIENLPKDVYAKIESIEFFDDDEIEDTGNQGLVFLENDYMFEFDMSQTAAFADRKDLIELIRNFVIKAN